MKVIFFKYQVSEISVTCLWRCKHYQCLFNQLLNTHATPTQGLSPQNGESKELHVHVTRVAKFIQPIWTPSLA